MIRGISLKYFETFKEQKKEDKKILKIVTKDLIRDLPIGSNKMKIYSAVLPTDKLKDILKKSKVLTSEEQWQLNLDRDNIISKKITKSQTRKCEADKWESIHKKGKKLSKIDEEAITRANHILLRADLMKTEQEDEIKEANRLVLSTKCHAIRCAQIVEKSLTRKELEMEERRLEETMESERLSFIASEEKKREGERLKKINYMKDVRQQIQEKEAEKIILAQILEEECQKNQKSMIKGNIEALESLRKRKKEQDKVKDDLKAINEQLLHLKKVEKEEEIMAELKIQEYMRQKAEREAERELEQMHVRQVREKEIARLIAMQERQQELHSKEDQIKAKRIQEEVEREWRRRECQLARRHAKEEKELKEARLVQIEQRKRMQAIHASLEKREFDKIVATQVEEREKLRDEEERKKQKKSEHRSALMRQINDKVLEKERQRQRVLEEGFTSAWEEKKRQQRIKNVMKNKIEELRIHKVPEVYIKEIEQQLKITGN